MKKNFLKKITALVMMVIIAFTVCACSPTLPLDSYPPNGARKVVETNKNLYGPTGVSEPVQVAYYENEPEILLIDTKLALDSLFKSLVLAFSPDETPSIKETPATLTFTRGNGAYCEIDFVKDVITFNDFDLFHQKGYASNPYDLLASPYVNEQGESRYIKRGLSLYTPCYSLEINLAAREIPLDIYNGKKFMPLSTFNDLFISPIGANLLYNGTDIFMLSGSDVPDELEDLIYRDEKTEITPALAAFNYKELCLFLDLYYGLQGEHQYFDGFDYYLQSIGLTEQLLSTDPASTFNALGTLTLGYISDIHSVVKGASPYYSEKVPTDEDRNVVIGNGYKQYVEEDEKYKQARSAALDGNPQLYQKVGNTAYVTFDSFVYVGRTGDYLPLDDPNQQMDTMAMITAVHKEITSDPDIENVVLDLSCNGGGAVDAAVYTVAWMLGSCDFPLVNSITGSRGITSYQADVNWDGVFDDDDTLKGKNLYCLISPVSFSCGNLVPALLKASNKVTMLGRTSGGGGCAVRAGVTADGTQFTISSPLKFTTVINGSHYNVDQGVTPDYVISKTENFYDRTALTDYINSLI